MRSCTPFLDEICYFCLNVTEEIREDAMERSGPSQGIRRYVAHIVAHRFEIPIKSLQPSTIVSVDDAQAIIGYYQEWFSSQPTVNSPITVEALGNLFERHVANSGSKIIERGGTMRIKRTNLTS